MITPVTIKSEAFYKAPLAAIAFGALILSAMRLLDIRPAIFESNCLEPLGLAINRWWDLPFLGLLVIYYLIGLRLTRQDKDVQQEYVRLGRTSFIIGIILSASFSTIKFVDGATPQIVHGALLIINLFFMTCFAVIPGFAPLRFAHVWKRQQPVSAYSKGYLEQAENKGQLMMSIYTKRFLKRLENKGLLIGWAIGGGIFAGFLPFAITVSALLLSSLLLMALRSGLYWFYWNLPRIKTPSWKKRLSAWWYDFDLLLILGIVEEWKHENETANPQKTTA